MTESIGEKLVATIGDIIPTYYSEAETDSYPYCVYDQTVSPSSTKDGVYKLTSTCSVKVISDTFDEAHQKSLLVIEAVRSDMNGDQYSAGEPTVTKECVEGVWTITLAYTIKQLY